MDDNDLDSKKLYLDLKNDKPAMKSFKWDKRFIDEDFSPKEIYEKYIQIYKDLKTKP
jgi:hypothetical protein